VLRAKVWGKEPKRGDWAHGNNDTEVTKVVGVKEGKEATKEMDGVGLEEFGARCVLALHGWVSVET
jgi:hypothetical protein